jgi:hypothetical protein
MTDKLTEKKIEHTKEFLELWMKFHETYKSALNKKTISPEEENNFLQTKSLIARKYQYLMDELEIRPTAEDRTMDVIATILSLESVATTSDMQLKKLEGDWHSSFLLLNRMVGKLEAGKAESKKTGVMALMTNKLYYIIALCAVILIFYFISKIFINFFKAQGILK